LNDFKTMRFSANYIMVVKKWIKSYVPNICSLIKLLLRRTLVQQQFYSTWKVLGSVLLFNFLNQTMIC